MNVVGVLLWLGVAGTALHYWHGYQAPHDFTAAASERMVNIVCCPIMHHSKIYQLFRSVWLWDIWYCWRQPSTSPTRFWPLFIMQSTRTKNIKFSKVDFESRFPLPFSKIDVNPSYHRIVISQEPLSQHHERIPISIYTRIHDFKLYISRSKIFCFSQITGDNIFYDYFRTISEITFFSKVHTNICRHIHNVIELNKMWEWQFIKGRKKVFFINSPVCESEHMFQSFHGSINFRMTGFYVLFVSDCYWW